MRTRLLLPALAACLFGLAPLSAQLQPGKWIRLPDPPSPASLATANSDHAKVAINERKDVFATWHMVTSTETYLVGTFLRCISTNPPMWNIPSRAIILGDPRLEWWGPGLTNRCLKPDVVAVGNDFVVAWPRIAFDSSGTGFAQLEMIVVAVDASGAPSFKFPVPVTGSGFVIDPAVVSGFAGVAVDLVALENPLDPDTDYVGAAYVSETSPLSPSGDVKNEIRFALVDITSFAQPTAVLSTVVEEVDSDLFPGSLLTLTGDKVLPDVTTDALGNVVLAYETFDNEDLTGAVAWGEVRVQRLAIDWSTLVADALVGDPVTVLQSGASSNLQRRPGVFRRFGETQVQIGWVVVDSQGFAGGTVEHFELGFGAPGASPTLTDLGPVTQSAGDDDRRPLPLTYLDSSGSLRKVMFFDRRESNGVVSLCEREAGNPGLGTPSPFLSGKRAAADVLEDPGSETLMAITQEGDFVLNGIQLMVLAD